MAARGDRNGRKTKTPPQEGCGGVSRSFKNQRRLLSSAFAFLHLGLHILDLLADLLRFLLHFIHVFAHASSGGLVSFLVELDKVLLEAVQQVSQFRKSAHVVPPCCV